MVIFYEVYTSDRSSLRSDPKGGAIKSDDRYQVLSTYFSSSSTSRKLSYYLKITGSMIHIRQSVSNKVNICIHIHKVQYDIQ